MESKMIRQIENVKDRKITVLEIVKERLTLLERHKSINAVICYDEKTVLEQAIELDSNIKAGKSIGKLCGAVITVKDNLEVKGLRATAGMKKFQNNIPSKDCVVVKKLRDEGAIILGKTNMPAGAMDMQTFNEIYGRTDHPDFPEYTCGGSSGGGAAAIKLGLCDADIGNDFMGSIRVPAHFCGIYGMVGTDKVIPLENMVGGKPYGSTMSNILRIGIQAANLSDLHLLFTIIADDSKIFPSTRNSGQLKIAYSKDCGELPISKEYVACFTDFIKGLSAKYYVNEIHQAEFNFQKSRECFLKLLYGNMSLSLPKIVRLMMGSKMSDKLKDYLNAEEKREECIVQLDQMLAEYDILLTPVTATASFQHKCPVRILGHQAIYDDIPVDDTKVSYSVANMGYTTPFSLTGNPVIVIPIGRTAKGLPLGIQVVGRRMYEHDLLKCTGIIAQCDIN
ncbi:amidase [Ruminiclostridium cellulolyticum]|uniref:Amidase n=1 Tax=Ruminiclostridium cellulolyticum (strain ATCC 35319 / DSM 5812 / JCM 6584 / H10) TaxID=394503 RepID=B8I6Y5_RUMCH|nr:amidase [Ruminiclostridium cellulolyticum]ACL76977.1 Amidase [Ruminiclostridium cellulolyticum H10]